MSKLNALMYTIVISLFSMFSTTAMSGVIYHEKPQIMVVSGQTNQIQMLSVYSVISQVPVKEIYISGPGGSLIDGLIIGHMIAKTGAPVLIEKGTSCISACAFAAITSREVNVEGKLLFHRPFIVQYPLNMTLDSILESSMDVSSSISMYFVRHGYSLLFWHEMAGGTNPCRFIKITSTEFLNRIRGNPLDPVPSSFDYEDHCEGTVWEAP